MFTKKYFIRIKLTLFLLTFFSNIISPYCEGSNIDSIHPEIFGRPPSCKFERAVQLCLTYNDRAYPKHNPHNSSIFDEAIKLCGADNYRLYPVTTWVQHFSNYFTGEEIIIG